jgi:serine/threonine protein kinase
MSDSAPNAAFLAPEPSELAPLFPGYEIEMLIATGGMGAVYRAIQKSLDRTVAIKILPREFSNDAAFCAGFEAEAKAMARLNHLNLVGVYDFGEVNGMLYIVMEYVAGKSLFHSSNGRAIDPSEVIRLVTGICEGLAHAHENGILHRDIKPSNILLDPNAQPKIGDFGLARPVENKIQEGEEIFGTPHYTAPEVVDSPNSVDYRADIFSVGVLLHELLTGRLPADDPRSASAISHCDPRFDAIVRRATHHNPEGRYGSASEIAQDLHNIANTAGPRILKTARPANPRSLSRPAVTTRHFNKPKSSGSPFIIFLTIAIIGGAIAYLLLSKNQIIAPHPIPPRAPESFLPKPKQTPPQQDTFPAQQRERQLQQERQLQWEQQRELEQQREQQREREQQKAREQQQQRERKQQQQEQSIPAGPKFEIVPFFKRARGIMHERSLPLIADRDNDLKKNLIYFDKQARRLLRKTESNDKERETVYAMLDSLIKESEKNQNRIQTKLNQRLKKRAGLQKLYDDCCKKQTEIDLVLTQSLIQLSSTYILGLQKQIERLQNQNDSAAIRTIEEELKKTREDETYFPDLMLSHRE